MKKWTKEAGTFVAGPDDLGTWNQSGIDVGGFASVGVWADDEGWPRVFVNSTALLTPAQARRLAKVLADTADRAEEESK